MSIGDKRDFPAAGAHADRLVALERLALGLQRRGDQAIGMGARGNAQPEPQPVMAGR